MRRSLFASLTSIAPFAILASTAGCVIVDPSCGGGGASILVTPSVVFVAIGESTTPRASWCRGGRYDNGSPDWSLSSAADANVISLDAATGRITGRRTGTATVIATADGVQGARVTVTVR